MGVLDGGFFGLAVGMASYVTVLPLFVRSLTDSAVLIGSISAIRVAGWQLPQLLTVNHVAQLRRCKPFVLAMTTVERLPFLGLAIVAFLVPMLSPRSVLALTFALLVVHGLAGGLTATAWQAMIAKVTAPSWRGRFFGTQSAAASLLGSVGALVAGLLLGRVAAPTSFFLCFLSAFAALTVSWLFLARMREADAEAAAPIERREAWARWLRLWRRDRAFQWFVVARMLAQVPLVTVAFLTVHGVERFGISAATAGLLTALFTVSQALGSLLAGSIGDRHGHRASLVLGVAAVTAAGGVAILAPAAAWLAVAFALAGAGNAAVWTSPLAMTLAFGAEHERPGYIGLSNSLAAPVTLAAPVLAGWLADRAGMEAAFAMGVLGGVAALLVLVLRVSDPGTHPAAGDVDVRWQDPVATVATAVPGEP